MDLVREIKILEEFQLRGLCEVLEIFERREIRANFCSPKLRPRKGISLTVLSEFHIDVDEVWCLRKYVGERLFRTISKVEPEGLEQREIAIEREEDMRYHPAPADTQKHPLS